MEDISSPEEGEVIEENKKKKKKHKSDKERKKKKKKSKESAFYNLDEYSKTRKKKRKRKSPSPDERKGLGYYSIDPTDLSSSSDSRNKDRHSDSHHQSQRSSHGHSSRSRRRAHSRSRSRSRDRSSHTKRRRRSRSRSQSVIEKVDKEKLLQIAKANLARMIKSGTLPKGVDINKLNLEQLRNLKEKNSISQWSEYCRAISTMEAAANEDSLSDSYSDSDDDENGDTKSVCSAIIRHPFKLKERKDIQIKVRDFAQLPTRSSKEIQKELTDKFPVSSGDTHRVKELEWIEVKPEMPPPAKVPEKSKKRVFKEVPDPKEETSKSTDQSDMSVTSSTSDQEIAPSTNSSEIGTLVALRLSAKKKLQEDPLNLVAIRQIYEAERLITAKMQEQALQNEQAAAIAAEITASQMQERRFVRAGIEQFSEGNRIKDGIGMHLLLKMGWQPGTGLGRNQKGTIEPIIPSLKFDTKGLVAEEETVSKIPAQVVDVAEISRGRNPISFLQEHCSKHKWDLPVYDMVEAVGPDHKKSFIMKCIVNGVEYRPSVSCGTKKQAKALAATVALQAYGLVEKEGT